MPRTPDDLDEMALGFLAERHLGTLATLRADGSPHLVTVGFTYDHAARVVRVITQAASIKAANAARGGRAAISQHDGPRWLTLEGTVRLADQPDDVERAVAAYASRYQAPRSARAATRVAIEIAIDRVMGRVGQGPRRVADGLS